MQVILTAFGDDYIDFILCEHEQPRFQRIQKKVSMSAEWAEEWVNMCDWRFEIRKLHI